MTGLFDLLKSDDPAVAQGLLQAGLSLLSSKGGLANALGGAGMAGLQGAGQFRQQAFQRQLQQAQMDDIKAQQAQRQAQADKTKQEAAEQVRKQGLLTSAFSPMTGGEAASAGGLSPLAAQAIGQRKPVDYQQLIAQGIDPKLVESLSKAPNFGRATVARTLERAGANGRPETIQLDEYGAPVGQGMPKAVEAKLMQLGGTTQAYDPFALKGGQTFAHTMTPEGRDSSARGWAGFNLQREKAAQDKEGAKWQYDATRGVQINQQTGEARPVMMDGKPIEAKGLNSDKSKQTAALAYSTIDKMLKHPGLDTAIGLSGQIDPRNYIWGTKAKGAQALIDQAQGQAFLQAFDTLKGGGQITEAEGRKATEAIARLQRSQGAGDFMAAARELQDLADLAHQRAGGGPLKPATPASGSVTKSSGQVIRFDSAGNMVQP